MTRNRRKLVLTSESSRHPYRMSLPPHVFLPDATLEASEQDRLQVLSNGDLRSFVNTYCAAFAVVATFIA